MRVLFDIVHPADVHFFKHAVRRLIAEGHELLLTSRVKDITLQLLDELDLPNTVVSKQGKGPIGLLMELARRNREIYRLARRFRPDVLVGNNSPSVSHVGFLLRRPSILFDDTEINRYVRTLYRGFVTEIHTPQCYRLDLGPKQIRYPGYHALAYLHPDHFRPEPAVLSSYGLSADEPYFLFRFVRWGASHDLGVTGLTVAKKEELVELASRYGRVVISAEDELSDSLKNKGLAVKVSDMHQILAGAAGVIGESATMCAEAACLGCPSVLIDQFGRGYTDDLEKKYGLLQRFPLERWNEAVASAEQIFRITAGDAENARCRKQVIADMLNVSEYQFGQITRCANMRKQPEPARP